MNRFLLILLVCSWCTSIKVLAQPEFSVEQTIASGMGGFVQVTAADMDGDGDLDIVSSSHFEDEILWYVNDGAGQFVATDTIATGLSGSLNSFAVFDADGDNDLDVVVPRGSTFFWYENDGSGTSFTQHSIVNGLISPKDIEHGDLDNDGDIDFAMVSSYAGNTGTHGVRWFKNDGSGNFTSSGYSNGYFYCVNLADLDDDGYLDLLYGSDDGIKWRNGNGSSFFSEDLLQINGYSYVHSIVSADIDNDNDLDVIAVFLTGGGAIVAFENNGSGQFNSSTVLSNSITLPGIVDTLDVNNDGSIDIICTASREQEVVWFENNGTGTFSTPQKVAENIAFGQFVNSADVDDDGWVDAVFCSRTEVGWAKNQSGVFEEAIVSSRIDSVQEVYAYDLDNDGDNDVIASTGSWGQSSIYLENLGTGTFAPQRVFFSGLTGTQFFSDNNNDQYLDMVFVRNGFYWAANDQSANFGTPQSIAGYKWQDEIIDVTDLNGDNNPDILIRTYDDSIVWISNLAASNGARNFAVQVPNYCCYSTECQDMDGDGDKDLFIYRVSGSLIQWYENNGNGIFTGPVQIDDLPSTAKLIDINNDNLLDVAAANGDTLYWYMNSPQGFGPPQQVECSGWPEKLYSVDMNLDNQMDIGLLSNGSIKWFQNTGNNSFEPDSLVLSITGDLRDAIFYDIDEDDREDIIVGGIRLLSWFGNLTEPTGLEDTETISDQIVAYPNPATSTVTIESQTPLAQVKLMDLAGRVALPTLYPSSPSGYATIDISSLPSGIYLLEAFTQDSRRSVQKVVVK